ncbi:LysR family transcriptional regulator [Pusillimonas sp. MFBS29]|uniref:LysR family transcriptional regulator n=1 Tax=Pusillimonas sp. MFBS29 TaxID=2886690 RepID=UPI001D128470|nr:LysR family transcriptional regulator [Pusillimonas sp. MFBS29]
MSIRELKTLVAVAEYGSISAAAERVFLSVPAAAAQVAKLESEFKTSLLNRARKPAQLTPQGLALVVQAKEVIARYSQLYEAVSSSEDLTGVLNIAAIPTALTGVIPRALIAFRKAHPRAQIRLEHGLSPSLAERLRHRELDAAIISEPQGPIPDLQWTAFTEEPIVVIARATGTSEQSDQALLRAHPYIRFNRHFWVNRIIEEDLQRRKLLTNPIMELDSLEAIGQMVRYGLGVSIIPLSSRSFLRLHKLKAVPFGEPGLTRSVVLAEPKDSAKLRLTSAFRDCLLRAGRQRLVL